MLSGSGSGRVVVEHGRTVERLACERHDVDVLPADEMERCDEHSGARVERAAAADADAFDLLVCETGLDERAATEAEEALEAVLRAALRMGRLRDEASDAAARRDD